MVYKLPKVFVFCKNNSEIIDENFMKNLIKSDHQERWSLMKTYLMVKEDIF